MSVVSSFEELYKYFWKKSYRKLACVETNKNPCACICLHGLSISSFKVRFLLTNLVMQRLNTVLLGFVRMCFRQGRGVRALCLFPVGAASWRGRFCFLVISWTALKQVDVIWNTQSVVTHVNHLKLMRLSKGSTAACYSFLSLPLYWRWWCEIIMSNISKALCTTLLSLRMFTHLTAPELYEEVPPLVCSLPFPTQHWGQIH